MSGKFQKIGNFTFCRPSQILPKYRIFARNLSQIFPITNLAGNADVPDGTNLSIHLSGMMADHCRNLGRVEKIERLPILQICPRSSQTIGNMYDFKFSLVGKIWESRETVKSQTVWDFLDIWKKKTGLSINIFGHHILLYRGGMETTLKQIFNSLHAYVLMLSLWRSLLLLALMS